MHWCATSKNDVTLPFAMLKLRPLAEELTEITRNYKVFSHEY